MPVDEAFHVIKYSMAETFGKVADCLSGLDAPDTKTIHDLDTELRALENSAWPWLKFGEWQTLPTEGDTTPQRHMIALLKDKALLGGYWVCLLREGRNTDFVGARHSFQPCTDRSLLGRFVVCRSLCWHRMQRPLLHVFQQRDDILPSWSRYYCIVGENEPDLGFTLTPRKRIDRTYRCLQLVVLSLSCLHRRHHPSSRATSLPTVNGGG